MNGFDEIRNDAEYANVIAPLATWLTHYEDMSHSEDIEQPFYSSLFSGFQSLEPALTAADDALKPLI